MPWTNQGGGGPWGPRGGNGGDGNGGGPPQGPDLEDLLRRGQDRMRSFLPGNMGGKGLLLMALAALVLWGFSGVYTIAPEEQGLVLRFGDYHRTTDPGLHLHAPYPIEKVIKVPVLTVRRVEVGDRGNQRVEAESLMLTGDENILDISFMVQWQVQDAEAFAFNIRNPDDTVKIASESAMREVIGDSDIAAALAMRRRLPQDSAEDLVA